jgi:hypothetical protein
MARRRRDAPDPTPDPAPQQQPAPAPDSAWAEKLAHAVAQARTQVDALSAAQQALATSTAAATQSQTGLAAALASVAAQSRKGAPGATPPASGGGAGQPPPAAAPPGATGGPGRASPAAPPAGLGAAVAQAARSQQVFGDAAASAAAKTGTLARSQGGLAGAVGGASDAMGRMASGSRNAADAGGKLAQSAQAVKGQSEKMATAGLAVAGAYAYASSKLLGFVKAGLAGTTTGEALSQNFQAIQREVASIFLPTITALIQRLQQVVTWFRNLSGEQQQNISRWAMITVGGLGLLTVIPKLVGAFGVLGGVLRTAIVANPLLVVAGAVAALMARTQEGRDTLKDLGTSLFEAFKKVGEILADVLVPLIRALTDVLSGPLGKIILFGTLGALAISKIFMAVKGLTLAITSMGVSFGAAIGIMTAGLGLVIAGIVALVTNASKIKDTLKDAEDIEVRLRTGKTSRAQAEKDIEDKVTEQMARWQTMMAKGEHREAAMEMAPFLRGGKEVGFGGSLLGEDFKQAISDMVKMSPEDRLAKAGEEMRRQLSIGVERGEKAGKDKAGRTDVVMARGGQEGLTDVIKRLEEASIKQALPQQQLDETKKQTTFLEDIQKMIEDMRRQLGVEPRPVQPPLPPVLPGG